jgi:hypothetical protein
VGDPLPCEACRETLAFGRHGRATKMNLKSEVREIMYESKTGLTVDEVLREVADRLDRDEIKSILNTLVKDKVLTSSRGAGPTRQCIII